MTSTEPTDIPHPLRQYALLADGERGALLGPRGQVVFLCAPRWHDDAVFSSLFGGAGGYLVRPSGQRYLWSGSYEQDTLIWRDRWIGTDGTVECREALAFPGDPEQVVLLRRIEALAGDACVEVGLDCRAGFGSEPMEVRRTADDVWEGRTGDLRLRWSGAPREIEVRDGRLVAEFRIPEGEAHELVLELTRADLPRTPPDPARTWDRTERAWHDAVPDLNASVSPGESHHSYAVLRGLTGSTGAMVAAATNALPEHAHAGRNYDYRYAWIRDQCFAGQAAAAIGDHRLLDSATRFVAARVLDDGPRLRPAYTVTGDAVPDESTLDLPGYPGAPVRVGNRANDQFQLDAFGESLLLFAAAAEAGRLDEDGRRAIDVLVRSVIERRGDEDSGIWELDDRRWAHSRLICAAGLRAVAPYSGNDAEARRQLADELVASATHDCLHSSGRWQRSPDDPTVDAALLIPGIRDAIPPQDPRQLRTIDAVIDELTDDGYVYRFRQDTQEPLHREEGAFLLSGFHLSLAELARGERERATRWFERTRGALGPPGLFAEEYDVVLRQLRGNLPQAFVHALLLETARRLHDAGVDNRGFTATDR